MLLPHALLLAAMLLQGQPSTQKLPHRPVAMLTEPDQELDLYSGKFKAVHLISAKVRGVRAANQTTCWVSAGNRHLTAYRGGKRLWLSNVAAPFQAENPASRIRSLVLSSELLFVRLSPHGMAEVDRKSGRITSKYFDRDPHNLRAE